jgi:hypothetical protein
MRTGSGGSSRGRCVREVCSGVLLKFIVPLGSLACLFFESRCLEPSPHDEIPLLAVSVYPSTRLLLL